MVSTAEQDQLEGYHARRPTAEPDRMLAAAQLRFLAALDSVTPETMKVSSVLLIWLGAGRAHTAKRGSVLDIGWHDLLQGK